MRWDVVLGLARTEARLTRRLVRYWVFLVLSAIFVILSYVYYAFLHGFFSSFSATVGSISPKYLVSGLGLWGMVLFMIGLVFLAFDVRSRDERERIVEVLDSRPCTNLELVAGRFLGLLFMGWAPLAVMMLAIQLVGWLGAKFGWWIGEPVLAESLAGFVVFMAVPALSFILGFVFLVSFLVRHRLVTALVTMGFLVGVVFVLFRVSFGVLPAVDLFGAYTLHFPSELMAGLFTSAVLIQRGAVLAAALGLLALAAAVHPRLDNGPRKLWAGTGAALLALAFAGCATLYLQATSAEALFIEWQKAHQERRDEPAPDLDAIRGQVTIDPGRSLAAELELELTAPAHASLESLLLTLNPGLEVQSVTGDSGETLAFTHDNGMLEVVPAQALAAGERTRVRVSFEGRPQPAFAYLDAALRISELKFTSANLALLGYEPSLFYRDFVALLPGIHWLPSAGATSAGKAGERPPDFFRLDLTVEVPEGWLIAGPGRRQSVEAAAGAARFRFAPPAVLPEAALVASRFERRAAEAAGVELEILVHPRHTGNLEILAPAREEILGWIDEKLQTAADLGLAYPYDALTLVEVPTRLQAFGGGWRMDTAMAPPAMLLMKESGFPTARFDNRFRNKKRFEDREGGLARAQLEALESYFESDFNGGNIFLGAARNFFAYQTASRGTGSLALDFVCHDLANRLTTDRQGFFSVHLFGSDLQQTSQNIIQTFTSPRRQGRSITEIVLEHVTEKPEVWEQALGVALADLDPWEDPERTVNLLALKGSAMSRWILDGLGREKAGELLATLRERTAGSTFDRADLMAVAQELGIDFGDLTGDWLVTTELPGILASDPKLYRLPDSAGGTPRYQLALKLKNDEATPGLVKLRYRLADAEEAGGSSANGDRRWQESDSIRLGAHQAIEVGMVLSKPPRELRVAPYLALNRTDFAVPLPTLDAEKIVEAEPFAGTRAGEWRSARNEAIVVDDLDPGFSVEADEEGKGLRLGAKAGDENLDQGLPVASGFRPPRDWSRRTVTDAWGKYRRTVAFIRKGQGEKQAVFTAEIERSGPWRLELHMLPSTAIRGQEGTYHLRVEDASGSQDLTFDASGAEEGWNLLGEIEIAAGQVRVSLSDETDGRAVVADAIRWRPARESRE